MYQKFTHDDSEECCNVMEKEVVSHYLKPRKETLAVIMQFACAYYVEKKLPARLSEMILN